MKICTECDNELTGNQSKYCSNACKQRAHWKKIGEQRNTYHAQTIRAYKRKIELIDLSGGKCQKCGYDKNISALQFHHRDVSKKSFSLDGRKLSNTKMELLLLEHAKCDLLCANCHSEHHNPEMFIDNIRKLINKDL
jgi:hypothetical protein